MNEFDIANLGTATIEGSEGEYEAPSEFFRPPTPGKVDLILDKTPEDKDFYELKDFETKEKIPGFSVNLKFKIQGGVEDGRTFFAFIDTRKARDRNGNMVQDYLRSAGFTGRLVQENDYKDAVKNHIGTATAKLTWTGSKCDLCEKVTVKKLTEFPLKSDGLTRAHTMPCPSCGETIGAKAKIAMFLVSKSA